VHTLLDFHFHPHVDAASGKQGMGDNRAGAAGPDLEIKVPDGTVVLDEDGPGGDVRDIFESRCASQILTSALSGMCSQNGQQ